ncbi:unnamed protein product [Schistosoma mattheei]|uniref:Uncharacterized protein n=1 Tax=Schistosoma mattheei TaxID=31246 RepID=A0A183PY34_9TREM|nr:unnamed protein product [Schistosoma mattheei]
MTIFSCFDCLILRVSTVVSSVSYFEYLNKSLNRLVYSVLNHKLTVK